MKKILTIIWSAFIYIIILSFSFEYVPIYFYQLTEKSAILNAIESSDNVVIIFDEFNSPTSHGKTVSSVFKTVAKNNDYSLFELDYTSSRGYTDLNNLVQIVLAEKKKVYVNLSFSPKSGVMASLLSDELKKIDHLNQVTITLASGNNHNTVSSLSSMLNLDYNISSEIDSKIYLELKNDKTILSLISRIEEKNIHSYLKSQYLTVNFYRFLNYIGVSKNQEDMLSKAVQFSVDKVLKNYNIDDPDIKFKIYTLYSENISNFLFPALIQRENPNVNVISAILPYDLESKLELKITDAGYLSSYKKMKDLKLPLPKYAKYLDCPIPDVINNDKRDLGLYFLASDNNKTLKPVLGTSIASPAFLARIFNKNNKDLK